MIIVSVCMITYNHEKYIAKAIDSVLMQKTNFDFELVIGDDVSKDKTRDILMSYKEKYPDIIKLIFNNYNIGGTKNFGNVYKNCTGKYIAILEGDDYWISDKKIQTQVDYLEFHTNYVGCFHRMNIVDSEKKFIKIFPEKNFSESVIDFEYLLINGNNIPTPTVMFKKNIFPTLPDVFFSSDIIGDLQLFYLISYKGKIGFIDEILAAYRKNSNVSCFSLQPIINRLTESHKVYEALDKYFNYNYHYYFKKNLTDNSLMLAREYFKIKDYYQFKFYYNKAKNYGQYIKVKIKIKFYLGYLYLFIYKIFGKYGNY